MNQRNIEGGTTNTSNESARDDSDWIATEHDTIVRERRHAAGLPKDGEPWGLALSGGGIRSATFCLGLIRGLAKNRLLRRFDYLSTVSGGGYVGASLGRMFGHGVSAEEIERGIESERSLWLWWLRANGRYLTPTGIRDLGQAAVSIVRGALATQLELGILLILLATVITLPHVLIATFSAIGRNADSDALPISFWFLLLPIPLFIGGLRLFGYWLSRAAPVRGGLPMMLGYSLLCAVLAVVAFDWTNSAVGTIEDIQFQISQLSWYMRIPVGTLLAAGAFAMLLGVRDARRIRADSGEFVVRELRLRYTRALLFWTLVFFGLIAVALIDWFSWCLATIADSAGGARLVYGVAGLAALALVLCRAVLPVLQTWMNKNPGQHVNLERLLGVVVYGLLISIVIGWATLVHDMVLPQMLWDSIDGGAGQFSPYPLVIWSLLFLFSLVFVALTGRNFETVNMASLHGYYRARIERAYVSSGNVSTEGTGGDGTRFDRHPVSSIDDYTAKVRPPDTVVRGDDVNMADYAPQSGGGPIHLINCCINQTVDDGSRYFNGDRKGVALTLASTGRIEIGVSAPHPPATGMGFLSKWIAISGAAAGSGMGSQTSSAYSALLFLSGMRLGMWQQCLAQDHRGDRARDPMPRPRGVLGRLPLKLQAILSELLGQFPGLGNDTWYVSDGGHFENTGVYPLIKREVPVIVVADCGADPKYLFEDMESMIRKVRIDFGAEIEFIRSADIPQQHAPALSSYLGTPETIGPEPDNACLLLGRIRYRSGARGMLLVVKPRRLEHLPFDTVAYADRHPKYPQQSTGDQFFDEAQWESYQKLGASIGQLLTPTLIAEARALVETEMPANSSLAEAQKVRDKFTTRIDRLRPAVAAGAAGAGIGLSLVLALWQGGGQVIEAWRKQIDQTVAQSKNMAERIAAGKPEEVDALAIVDLRGLSRKQDESFGRVMLALENCAAPHKTRCEELKRSVDRVLALQNRDYWNTFHILQKRGNAKEVEIIEPAAETVATTVASTPIAPAAVGTGAIEAPVYPSASGRSGATTGVGQVPLPPDDATDPDDAGLSPDPLLPEPLPPLPPETMPQSLPPLTEAHPISGAIPLPVESGQEPRFQTRPVQQNAATIQAAARARAVADEKAQQRNAEEAEAKRQAETQRLARNALVKRANDACDSVKIYVHIYNESSRPGAQCLLDAVEATLGERPEGVENVRATAMRRGKASPLKSWGIPAVLYGEQHASRLAICANNLKTLIGGKSVVRTLPARPGARTNLVEIWLPADWRGDAWVRSKCRESSAKDLAGGR
jgi:hypothetical protein